MRKIIALAILISVSAIPAHATTKLYCKSQTSSVSGLFADNYASLAQSVLPFVSSTTNTTASGTLIQITKTAGGAALACATPPFAKSGTTLTTASGFTANFWASESNASANAGMRVIVTILRTGCVVIDTSKGTELTTSMAVQNWTATQNACPYITGDRELITPYVTNVGTMGGAQTVTMDYAGKTGAADGDSFVTVPDSFTLFSEAEFIQAIPADCSSGTVSFFAMALPGSTVAGNLLIPTAFVQGGDTLTISGTADGSSFTGISTNPILTGTGGTDHDYFWYKANSAGGGVQTFTATKNATDANAVCLSAREYGGMPSSAFDVTASVANSSAGSTSMSSNASPAVNFPDELIIGFEDDGGATFTAGSGFVYRNTASEGLDIEEQSVYGGALTTYTATGTLSPSADWLMTVVIFKWGTQPSFTMSPSIRGEEDFCSEDFQ